MQRPSRSKYWAGALQVAIVTAIGCLGPTGEAQGQMFGNRAMGGSLSRQSSPSNNANQGFGLGQSLGAQGQAGALGQAMSAASGGLTGNERFLRQNRANQGFIGDRIGQRFVGGTPGAAPGLVRSAVAAAAQQDRTNPANRPLPEPPATRPRPYPARLRVGFEPTATPMEAPEISAAVSTRLNRLLASRGIGPIQVELVDRLAILRGEVAEARESTLVHELIRQEPGVSAVQNELVVREPAEQSTEPAH